MSTFDIQDIIPDGYELVDIRRISVHKLTSHWGSFDAKVTLRKKFSPKVGEIIAVGRSPTGADVFLPFDHISRRLGMQTLVGCTDGSTWPFYRQLTPEERGE